ncbi:hypothetical protein AciX9_4397 (plasmid) [Granulicella tundricola MP5ACTX9]|uniref:Carbohydrate-binding protein n=1 Tax=Granulicella tundricola (strain ATCC BAA-1859 / DSM 23138 / MP5ACTX9) TaxID=1198114 RepID=E8X7B4_GRATM|nr:hypothetical protein AciX9_4397 [Granulicella tundricola MP5ACTX9]
MRKILLGPDSRKTNEAATDWIDLCEQTTAEISSEDHLHPLEDALRLGTEGGWRASTPGPQQIRLKFNSPQHIRRIRLEFTETQVSRSQEFALFVTTAREPRREILRQQWSFSPSGSTTELEDYKVDLPGVTVIDLELDPGRHDAGVFASLQALLIG